MTWTCTATLSALDLFLWGTPSPYAERTVIHMAPLTQPHHPGRDCPEAGETACTGSRWSSAVALGETEATLPYAETNTAPRP